MYLFHELQVAIFLPYWRGLLVSRALSAREICSFWGELHTELLCKNRKFSTAAKSKKQECNAMPNQSRKWRLVSPYGHVVAMCYATGTFSFGDGMILFCFRRLNGQNGFILRHQTINSENRVARRWWRAIAGMTSWKGRTSVSSTHSKSIHNNIGGFLVSNEANKSSPKSLTSLFHVESDEVSWKIVVGTSFRHDVI